MNAITYSIRKNSLGEFVTTYRKNGKLLKDWTDYQSSLLDAENTAKFAIKRYYESENMPAELDRICQVYFMGIVSHNYQIVELCQQNIRDMLGALPYFVEYQYDIFTIQSMLEDMYMGF